MKRAQRTPKNEEVEDDDPPEPRKYLWKLTPRNYAILLHVIADLEIVFEKQDTTGRVTSCLKKLRKLARYADVKYGLNKSNSSHEDE